MIAFLSMNNLFMFKEIFGIKIFSIFCILEFISVFPYPTNKIPTEKFPMGTDMFNNSNISYS